jgi:hypothetical protein
VNCRGELCRVDETISPSLDDAMIRDTRTEAARLWGSNTGQILVNYANGGDSRDHPQSRDETPILDSF